MFELLHELADWTLRLADSDWAIALLALVAFSESIAFPIPPDPLLVAVGVANPSIAIWVAALVAVASVCGALVGYALGRRVGKPVLRRIVSEDKTARAEAMFARYGAWAILAAAITPIPYKVFTVLAGVMELPLRPFLIASIVGRGARFLIIGALIYVFGESVQGFIDHNFELLTIAGGAALVAVVAAYLVYRARFA